jgi:hypothetical protein
MVSGYGDNFSCTGVRYARYSSACPARRRSASARASTARRTPRTRRNNGRRPSHAQVSPAVRTAEPPGCRRRRTRRTTPFLDPRRLPVLRPRSARREPRRRGRGRPTALWTTRTGHPSILEIRSGARRRQYRARPRPPTSAGRAPLPAAGDHRGSRRRVKRDLGYDTIRWRIGIDWQILRFAKKATPR